MCNCTEEMNTKLEPHGGRLAMGFAIRKSDMTMFGRLLIQTEKNDKSKRNPLPVVFASYCPFCGAKCDA